MTSTAAVIKDTILEIRDQLQHPSVIDPLASKRPGNSKFVMTSYPRRQVFYPLITVQLEDFTEQEPSGMRSQLMITTITIEIRVWTKNVEELDRLSQDVMNRLRNIQYTGAALSDNQGLHDFKILSTTNIFEEGRDAIRSRVIMVSYMFVLGE